MGITVFDAFIDVRHPGTPYTDSPDFHIERASIASMRMSRRGRERKDSGTIVLYNDTGAFTLDSSGNILGIGSRIHSGDRVDIHVSMQGDAHFGEATFGDGGFGGDQHRFTGIVRDVEYNSMGPTSSTLTLVLESFVGGILSMREVTDAWENARLSGTSDSVVDRMLADYAPEIDTTRVESETDTISYTADRENLLDILSALAARSGKAMWSRRDRLYFDDPSQNGVDPLVSAGDFTVASVRESDIGLKNSIRVDGAESQAVDATNPSSLDTSSEPYQDGTAAYTPSSYTTVTQSSRLYFEVPTRKSRIDRIEIWTRLTGSGENIRVRIQKANDAGNAPIAEADESSDIESHQLGADDELFLDDDGFSTFIFPEHTLPEPNPWVIVETDGDTGQDIGIDVGNSEPAYVNWYPFVLSVRQTDPTSRTRHRRRDLSVRRENIQTLEEAQELGNQLKTERAHPERRIQFAATEPEAAWLEIEDGVPVTWADVETASGTWVVKERDERYNGSTVETVLTAEEQ